MSIEDKVLAWLNGSKGADVRGAAMMADVEKEAERLKTLLFSYLPDSLKPMGADVFRIGKPRFTEDGFDIDITVDSRKVRRPSLQPSKYPDGVENIIKNFNVGWETRLLPGKKRHRQVKGQWHGEEHWNRPVYPRPGRSGEETDAVQFIQAAVQQFIDTSKYDTIVTINDEYRRR